jgi:TolA-binding protein
MKLFPESARRNDFVPVDVSEARVARIWSAVSPRLNHRRRWPWFVGAGVAACAAALVIFVVRPDRPANPEQAVSARAPVVATDQPREVVLGDGSEIKLLPRTQVVVAKEERQALELDLEHGVVHCEVEHVPGRRFVVRAGEVSVLAVGTQFSVTRHGARARGVSVDVQQGVVEVHAGGKVERLVAGQHWESPPAAPAEAARAAEPAAPPSVARHNPEQSTAPASSGTDELPEASEREDARKMFETANQARRAGDMRAAASGYEALLRRYPKDGRATVAALELGRLRMDHLGDHAGAISPLNRAARSGGGSVREDAMARLVRAYAATGSLERCLRARENYERSYPEGHHRAEVRAACGPR